MKMLITLILSALLTAPVFAQNVSICTDEVSAPCELSKDEAKSAFLDMMLSNFEGLKLVKSTGLNGLTDIPTVLA